MWTLKVIRDTLSPHRFTLTGYYELTDLDQIEMMTLCSITLSSLFYTLIWYRPHYWMEFCKSLGATNPVSMMANLAYVLKLFQFGMITTLLFYFDDTRCDKVWSRLQTPLYLVPGAACIAFGQLLNMRVYQLLGENGVYYGSKLGRPIPWITAWPYNSIDDPQYTGALLSLLGAKLLGLASTYVCGGWVLNYFYLIWLEHQYVEPKTERQARIKREKAEKKAALVEQLKNGTTHTEDEADDEEGEEEDAVTPKKQRGRPTKKDKTPSSKTLASPKSPKSAGKSRSRSKSASASARGKSAERSDKKKRK